MFQPELLKELSNVLKHGGNSPVARMQAGLQLKNALYSKDPAIRLQYQQRWMQFPLELRNYVKTNVSIQMDEFESGPGLQLYEFTLDVICSFDMIHQCCMPDCCNNDDDKIKVLLCAK